MSLVQIRLKREVSGKLDLANNNKERDAAIIVNQKIVSPKRTDTNEDERPKKYIYVISNEQFGANIYKNRE